MQARFFMAFIILIATVSLTHGQTQSNLENLYIRKAVKDYVAKQYDDAIRNLNQVLAVNRQSIKAKKLMAKCYVRKAELSLARNNATIAMSHCRKALQYDPLNEQAAEGIKEIQASTVIRQQQTVPKADASSQSDHAQGTGAVPSTPAAPIVITPQMMQGADSSQIKVITALLENFQRQQEIMNKQIEASSDMMVRTEDTKDKYLNALVASVENRNTMMKQFVFVGGGIALVVVLVLLFVFGFIFYRYSKSTALQTVQANEAIAALLTAPGASAQGQPPLMITASGQVGQQGQQMQVQSTPVDALSTEDPIQRAQAVEAVAAEIVEPEKNARLEKIRKLEELLHDENNRVRANAAKALYEIDKEASLTTLRDMLGSTSKRMRASAIWALGEIGSEEALNLILGVTGETDEIVTYNIKVALEKVQSLKRFPPSQEQQSKIQTALAQFADMT